jgi:hypothetical protein
MDKFQRKLRLLIATGSTIGFMGGWALLAHAGKPASNTDTFIDDTSFAPITAQAATPAPLPPLDFTAIEAGQGTASVQPLVPQSFAPQPTFVRRARLRTSGS